MRACLLTLFALLGLALTIAADTAPKTADDKKPDEKKADDKKPADKAEPKPLPYLTVDKLVGKYKELVPTLIEGLADTDPMVRQTAAYTLANLGKDALPLLIAATSNMNREVRANAAQVLGQFGRQAQDAIPALLTLMKDPDPEVRLRANYAMSRILGDSVPPPAPPALLPLPLPAPKPPDKEPEKKEPDPAPAAGAPPRGVIPAGYTAPLMLPNPGILLPRTEPRRLPGEAIPSRY